MRFAYPQTSYTPDAIQRAINVLKGKNQYKLSKPYEQAVDFFQEVVDDLRAKNVRKLNAWELDHYARRKWRTSGKPMGVFRTKMQSLMKDILVAANKTAKSTPVSPAGRPATPTKPIKMRPPVEWDSIVEPAPKPQPPVEEVVEEAAEEVVETPVVVAEKATNGEAPTGGMMAAWKGLNKNTKMAIGVVGIAVAGMIVWRMVK